jgi:uncharacterized membrane protein YphA (DoxX/SURF4 family)
MKQIIKTFLWIILGVIFLLFGGSKIINPDQHVENFAHWGYPLWFMYLTGGIEVVAGIALWIPLVRLYGVLLLSITMIGASITHLRAGEMGAVPIPIVLLFLLLTLAWTMKHPRHSSTSNSTDH